MIYQSPTLKGFGAVRTAAPPTSPGIQLVDLLVPGAVPYKLAKKPVSGLSGPGAEAGAFGLSLGVLAAVVIIAGAANYQLGKAMAPSKAKESKWAWGSAIGGIFVPVLPVGMAVYKNYFLS